MSSTMRVRRRLSSWMTRRKRSRVSSVRGGGRAAQRLRVGGDRRQRRSQLVRDRRDELRLQAVELGDPVLLLAELLVATARSDLDGLRAPLPAPAGQRRPPVRGRRPARRRERARLQRHDARTRWVRRPGAGSGTSSVSPAPGPGAVAAAARIHGKPLQRGSAVAPVARRPPRGAPCGDGRGRLARRAASRRHGLHVAPVLGAERPAATRADARAARETAASDPAQDRLAAALAGDRVQHLDGALEIGARGLRVRAARAVVGRDAAAPARTPARRARGSGGTSPDPRPPPPRASTPARTTPAGTAHSDPAPTPRLPHRARARARARRATPAQLQRPAAVSSRTPDRRSDSACRELAARRRPGTPPRVRRPGMRDTASRTRSRRRRPADAAICRRSRADVERVVARALAALGRPERAASRSRCRGHACVLSPSRTTTLPFMLLP